MISDPILQILLCKSLLIRKKVAASSLHAEVVELLLREGADTSVVGDDNYG